MERSSRVVLNQRVQPIPKRDRAASGESSVVGEGLAELHFDFLIFFSSNFYLELLSVHAAYFFCQYFLGTGKFCYAGKIGA